MVCPAGFEKRFSQGLAGLEPHVGARIRKKIRGGGKVNCAPRAKQGKVPI